MSTPITYFNQVITSASSNTVAEISKTYDSFIKKKIPGRDTYVVVDKFKIDLSSVPLIIFDPTPNAYSIELSCGALFSGRISLHTYFYSSNPGLPTSDPTYYWIYTFDKFIQILNNALAAAYTAIVAGVPAGNAAPFFVIDHTTHILSLMVSASYIEGAVNQIMIYGNYGFILPFLEGMDWIGNNTSMVPLVNGRDARMCCRDRLVNQTTLGGVLYYQQITNAKADTIIKWNVCKGLVITSGLQTQGEAFPEGQGITTTTGVVNNSLSSTNILMNFDLLYADNCRPLIVTYTAPSFDKKVLLNESSDINEISFKFFWYDKFNKMYPLHIFGNDICSLRIGFTE